MSVSSIYYSETGNQEMEKYSVKRILVPMDGSTESFR